MNTIYMITGVTGFLGNHIAAKLIAAGERVRGFVLPGDPFARFLPRGVQVVNGDITNAADLDRFFEMEEGQEGVVIHCAGIISMSIEPVPLVHQVNVDSVVAVARRCLSPRIRKMLYVASVHAITELPHGQVMSEPEHTDPDSVYGYYAKTKAEACAKLMAMREKEGLKLSILYPSGMSGPGDYAKGNFTQLFVDYAAGHIPMAVKGGYNFVDVRDVADAIIEVADRDLSGQDFILAGEYASVVEILQEFARILGRKPVKLVAPMWLAKLALPFFMLYYRIRKTKPVFSRYSLFTISTNSRFSSEKVQRQLDYRPRPFRQTIHDTMEWMKNQGMLCKDHVKTE